MRRERLETRKTMPSHRNAQVPPAKEENIEMDTEDIFDYGDNEIGEEEIQKMLEISKENYMFDFSAGFK